MRRSAFRQRRPLEFGHQTGLLVGLTSGEAKSYDDRRNPNYCTFDQLPTSSDPLLRNYALLATQALNYSAL